MLSSNALGGRARVAAENAVAGRAILISALALGLAGDMLLRAWPWGLNVAIWLASLCAVAVALPRFHSLALPRHSRPLWLWAALAFSLTLAWRSSPVLQTLNLLAVLLCLAMVAFRTSAGTPRLAGITEYAANLLLSAVHFAFGTLELFSRHLDWQSITSPDQSARLRALVRGLAIAALPLIVFGALFASADVFFRNLIGDAVLLSPARVFSHVSLWLIFSWLAGSCLWGALLAEREPLTETPRIDWLRFEFIETGVVFGLIDALFLTFVIVQFRYLFGGASRVESSSSLTYAQYARHGFFELVAVAALVVPFLLFTHWLLPRANARLHGFYGIVAGVLVLLVFVVMASALQRMRLYQQTFGLTELRVYTTAFMLWLFAVLVWLVFTVLRGRRDRFTFGVLVAGLAVVVALNAINPDALIVQRNAAIAASNRPFDSAYALGLGPDSVPALIANFDKVAPADRCAVASDLRHRYLDEAQDWRSWSWGRFRARRAVSSSSELTSACEAAAGAGVAPGGSER